MAFTITLVDSTPYMLRYRLDADASAAATALIANDTTTSGPNLYLDSKNGQPMRAAIDISGLASSVAAAEAVLFENTKLRMSVISTDPLCAFSVSAPNPSFHAGRAWITVGVNNTQNAVRSGWLTIEFRHSEER